MIDNEIKILQKIQGSKLVNFFGVFKTKEKIHILMDYIKGKNLQLFRKNTSKFKIYQRRKIIFQILTALLELKTLGIIHRDIKPANIIIDHNLELKIIDFGLALDVRTLSHQFFRCGTPGYIDPTLLSIPLHQQNDFKFDFRIDLFGVGVILYELIYNKQLFKAENQ